MDVDVYAQRILGWDRARLIADARDAAPAALEPRFTDWLDRRTRREPTAYIVGEREFWGLPFRVSPAVLIPRPETELIVEAALPLLRALPVSPAPRVADIGTGSGVLAVSIAHDVPACQVTATDISADALVVARANARANGVGDRVTCVCTSYLDGVDGPFDLIVANPPYVKQGDKPGLSPDVRHEPDVALFGGADGLRDIGGVLDAATTRLVPGGWFLMEFGFGQEDDVRALVAQRPAFRFDRTLHDLQGLARTAVLQRL